MAQTVWQTLDFNNSARIENLPNPVNPKDAANREYVDSVIDGLNGKTSVRVASQSNINIASPGASIDAGITLTSGDRVLIKAQSILAQNGIYLFDTASTPLVRSTDANTFKELEQAVVSVEEGTNTNLTFRQTQINGVIDVNDVIWVSFGVATPPSSESTAGIAEIATQAEVDTGTDDTRIVTPLKLSTWSGRLKKFTQLIGDGSATSFTVTHNFNTRDVQVSVFYNSGVFDDILVEIQRTSVNAVTIVFSSAPTSNQFKVVVIG